MTSCVEEKRTQPLPDRISQAGLCLFFTVCNIVHDVTDIALQQAAEMVYGVGIDIFATLDGVVVGARKSHFHQAIGRDALGFHRYKQRLVAYHPVTSQTYSLKKYSLYVRYYVCTITGIYYVTKEGQAIDDVSTQRTAPTDTGHPRIPHRGLHKGLDSASERTHAAGDTPRVQRDRLRGSEWR